MRLSRRLSPAALVGGLVLASTLAGPAEAQGFLNKLKQKAQAQINQTQDQAAQSVVNGATNIVKCSAGDSGCIQQAQTDGKTVVTSKGDTIRPAAPSAGAAAGGAATTGGAAAGAAGGAPAGPAPGTGVWVNWDFKPGERPIFVEDFARDEVGDFPRRMQLLEGNFEVATTAGLRLLRTTTQGAFAITLPENLPDRFTLEFDELVGSGWIYVAFDPKQTRYATSYTSDEWTSMMIRPGNADGGLVGGGANSISPVGHVIKGTLHTVRLMVDGAYAKMYIDDKRVANVPNTKIPRGNKVSFNIYSSDPTFIGNIRIAAGGKKLYDAIVADGHVATQGIYFDTGKDQLRPESSATLKEIAQMLTDHPDLKLAIEGHTDNVGVAATNQSLSDRRAAAVRAALVGTYSVAPDRLTSRGLGASKPVAPNTTEEGRQQNRRVELVKS